MSRVPGSTRRKAHRMVLPVCPACVKAARRVEPLSFIPGLECRLEVHRRFRRAFESINGPEYIEWT